MREIVLASSSPRRIRLMNGWGLRFRAVPPGVREDPQGERNPRKLVMRLSRLKAEAVAGDFPRALIVGSDLVVSFRGRIIGKPKSAADAVRTLKLLSGKEHKIFVGVTVLDAASGRARTACVAAAVRMRRLSEGDIADYVRTGEPLDKAGSYAIQGRGARLVSRVRGSRSAVIGLPRRETLGLLRKAQGK